MQLMLSFNYSVPLHEINHMSRLLDEQGQAYIDILNNDDGDDIVMYEQH